jgi:hypothetical protein
VRDALVVATAQIGRLVCDEWLGLWLHSLARAECLRRDTVPASDADEPAALPNTDDADSRLMAWKTGTSMPADEVALEVNARHDVDLRLVLGLQPEPPAQRVLRPGPRSPPCARPLVSVGVGRPVLRPRGLLTETSTATAPPAPPPMRVKQVVVAL